MCQKVNGRAGNWTQDLSHLRSTVGAIMRSEHHTPRPHALLYHVLVESAHLNYVPNCIIKNTWTTCFKLCLETSKRQRLNKLSGLALTITFDTPTGSGTHRTRIEISKVSRSTTHSLTHSLTSHFCIFFRPTISHMFMVWLLVHLSTSLSLILPSHFPSCDFPGIDTYINLTRTAASSKEIRRKARYENVSSHASRAPWITLKHMWPPWSLLA